jgi:hypothetical protein
MKKLFIWKKTNQSAPGWKTILIHLVLFVIGIAAGLLFVRLFLKIC